VILKLFWGDSHNLIIVSLSLLRICVQAALLGFQYDWVPLLKSDLGLSEVGLRSLLFRRADMQDAATDLTDSDQMYATALRKKFDPTSIDDSVG